MLVRLASRATAQRLVATTAPSAMTSHFRSYHAIERTQLRSLRSLDQTYPIARVPSIAARLYSSKQEPPDSKEPVNDEFSGPKSPEQNTRPSSTENFAYEPPRTSRPAPGAPSGAPTSEPGPSEPAPSEPGPSEPEKASQVNGGKPLPDLRFGIPSTFAEEFMNEKGEKADKGEQAGNPADPDITEKTAREEAESPEATAQAGAGAGGRGEGEYPRSAYETSIERRRNMMARYMYMSMLAGALAFGAYLGRNWETEEEEKAHADAPSGWGLGLFYNRVKARLSSQTAYYTEPAFPKLLPDVDPTMRPPGGMTLVISLEDMMVHNEWTRQHGYRLAKRPGLDYFLRYLSQYYELVLFTSLPSVSADPIISKLDPFRIITWPLFREATKYDGGDYVKDLSYLNRDLSKVIIIDSNAGHVKNQPENAIILNPWKGDPTDKDLVALIPFLEHVATMGIQDVRPVLASFKGKHIPTEFAAREARARAQFNKQLEAERSRKSKHGLFGSVSGALGMKPAGGLMIGDESVSEGLEKGKMLSDQIRERGIQNYMQLEKEIRENGEKWLKELEAEQQRMQEEQMKGMKTGLMGWIGGGQGKPSGKPSA